MSTKKTTTKANKVSEVKPTNNTTIVLNASFYQLDDLKQKCFEYNINGLEFNDDKLTIDLVIGSVINKFFSLYKLARKNGKNLGVKANSDLFVNITNEAENININATELIKRASVRINGIETLAFKFRINKYYESAIKLGFLLKDLISEFSKPFEVLHIAEIGGNSHLREQELKEANKLLKLEARKQAKADYEALSVTAKTELQASKLVENAERVLAKAVRQQIKADAIAKADAILEAKFNSVK